MALNLFCMCSCSCAVESAAQPARGVPTPEQIAWHEDGHLLPG